MLPSVGCCHGTAGFGTSAAGLGKGLAMRHVMACAFGAAGIADLGTQLTQCDGMLTATRSERGAQAADLGAVHVAADAGGHGGDVGLLQTGSGAEIAGLGTGIAGIDAGLHGGRKGVGGLIHENLLVPVEESFHRSPVRMAWL